MTLCITEFRCCLGMFTDELGEPDWMGLAWDDTLNSLRYRSGRLCDLDNRNPMWWLPVFNIERLPAEVQSAFTHYSRGSSESPEDWRKMHEIHWFVVRLDPRYEQDTALLTDKMTFKPLNKGRKAAAPDSDKGTTKAKGGSEGADKAEKREATTGSKDGGTVSQAGSAKEAPPP